MLKTTWVAPFLVALFWASCRDEGGMRGVNVVHSLELDARYGICGFCSSMLLILLVRQARAWGAFNP